MLPQYSTLDLEELESKAQKIIEKPIFDFIQGGAGNEWALKNNRNSFGNYQIIPKVLQEIDTVDTSLKILGSNIESPVLIAPCAFHKLVNTEGEIATAKACANAGTIMTLSTMSSKSIEEVGEISDFPKWFQLYIFKNKKITEQLIKRAELSKYKALVITVDVPTMGLRKRDIRNNFSLPTNVKAVNFIAEKLDSLSDKVDGSKIKEHTDQQFNSKLSWKDIDWISTLTKLPIILKGILNPEDALEALHHNVSAIIISNHGGRQIDGVISPIDALPNITRVIKNKIPLLIDGGFRTGEDIFKAIALGASAVLIGRPILWSLALGGEKQVINTLQTLKNELILIMQLTGCKDLKTIRNRGYSLLTSQNLLQQKLIILEEEYKKLLKKEIFLNNIINQKGNNSSQVTTFFNFSK